MIVTNAPAIMYHLTIFPELLFTQMFTFVGAHWHNVGSAIRKENPCTPKSYFGHMVCKITNRMCHSLIFCCNACRSRIIISAKMRRNAAAFTGTNNFHKWIAAFLIHNYLCGLHHGFHLQTAWPQIIFLFYYFKQPYYGCHLFRDSNLGKHHNKIFRKSPICFRKQLSKK